MAFYDLAKQQRNKLVVTIKLDIFNELTTAQLKKTLVYFANEDTYIRKSAYLSVGRIYFENKNLQPQIITQLNILQLQDDYKNNA